VRAIFALDTAMRRAPEGGGGGRRLSAVMRGGAFQSNVSRSGSMWRPERTLEQLRETVLSSRDPSVALNLMLAYYAAVFHNRPPGSHQHDDALVYARAFHLLDELLRGGKAEEYEEMDDAARAAQDQVRMTPNAAPPLC